MFRPSIIRNIRRFSNTVIPVIKRKDKGHVEQSPYFTDRRQVVVSGGKGGDGCVSFSSIYGNEHAGPDGGDGGNGGHVIFQATGAKRSLEHLSSIIKAEDGTPGRNDSRTGANADHTIVEVPLGTMVEDGESLLTDLNEENLVFIAARGGQGGKGNRFFATAANQSPELSEYGGDGETKKFLLEMAIIADFGLVGYPNAGKSSLLRAISRARPKVAGYCFTTLRPHVGIVEWDDGMRVAVADIPGLLPLAHKNHGLGIDFLRHIQRCSSLIFVLDFELDLPLTQLDALLDECRHYDPQLLQRKKFILANKMDSEKAKENFKKYGKGLIPISAKFSFGLTNFLKQLRKDRVLDEDVVKEVFYEPSYKTSTTKCR